MARGRGPRFDRFAVVITAVMLLSALGLGAATYALNRANHDREFAIIAAEADGEAQFGRLLIERWLSERDSDARTLRVNRGLAERAQAYIEGSEDNGTFLQERLDAERAPKGFVAIWLLSEDGSVRKASPMDAAAPAREYITAAIAAMQSRDNDRVFLGMTSGRARVAWIAPMESPEGEIVGCLVIEDDVMNLVTALQSEWPGKGSSNALEIVPMTSAAIASDRAVVSETAVPGAPWKVRVTRGTQIVRDSTRVLGATSTLVALMMLAVELSIMISVARTRRFARVEHEAAQETAAALAIQDRFLAGMSHELRTPLNSIIGFTSILRSGMAGELNEEQHRQLSMVHESSKRLLALVNDVLDLSKLKAGKQDIEASPFTAGEVCYMVFGLMEPLADHKALQLDLDVPETVIGMSTDRDMVERILLNLLSNAIKFTDSGIVVLRLEPGDDGTVTFSVTDTGHGIAPDHLAHVMEEFRQIVEVESGKPVGTGLGLAISKRMAEALGGTLTAESEVAVGSTFTFTVPRVYDGDGEAKL